ncbi:hypothetical protein ANN_14540 [Periplaneta americana]|uniref:Uncharacterized protein n=1 Tax=Periplaneta americana TaxID=6978 RepID=A0ABQ8SX85_PERAM|nr:hypothetical protein ANN_14540 [Periplaneta americana]
MTSFKFVIGDRKQLSHTGFKFRHRIESSQFSLVDKAWLFNDAVSTTRLFSVDEIGDSELIFGEMRPRIRHRLPRIHITIGENLGKTKPDNRLIHCLISEHSGIFPHPSTNRNTHFIFRYVLIYFYNRYNESDFIECILLSFSQFIFSLQHFYCDVVVASSNMPKFSVPLRSKLQSYVNTFGSDVFCTDGKVLTCKICEQSVNYEYKYFISQHISTTKHKNALSKATGKKISLLPTVIATSSRKSQFAPDLG